MLLLMVASNDEEIFDETKKVENIDPVSPQDTSARSFGRRALSLVLVSLKKMERSIVIIVISIIIGISNQ